MNQSAHQILFITRQERYVKEIVLAKNSMLKKIILVLLVGKKTTSILKQRNANINVRVPRFITIRLVNARTGPFVPKDKCIINQVTHASSAL